MKDQDLTQNFTVKIQHAHGQKMIDSPCSITDQDLNQIFTVKIQHAHGQKLIGPPIMTDQDVTQNFTG